MRNSGELQVPLHLRNAPSKLLKSEGYGKDYKNLHHNGGFVNENYFPINMKKRYFYKPLNSGLEKKIKDPLNRGSRHIIERSMLKDSYESIVIGNSTRLTSRLPN